MSLFGPPNIERMKASRNVNGLVKALAYKNNDANKQRDVRQNAALALGSIGDGGAIEPLIATLKDGNEFVRQAAAKALGCLGDARAVEPLVAALEDRYVRDNAACALEKIGSSAVGPLTTALRGGGRAVRWKVAEVLGAIGDTRAVEPLLVTLMDKDKDSSKAAAMALENIGWKPGKDATAATYWIVQQDWAQCAEVGVPAAASLIALLKDISVRRTAAETLEKIGAPAVVPLIAALMEEDSCESVAEVLGAIGDARAVEPLIAALKTKHLRFTAVIALGKIGDARAVEPLLAVFKDADGFVRDAATQALEKVGWKPGNDEAGVLYRIAKEKWEECVIVGVPAVEPLIAALKSDKAGAAFALGEIGDTRAVDALMSALKHGNRETRRAAGKALVRMGVPVLESLIAELKSKKESVREAAVEALGNTGDARAVKPLIAVLSGDDESMRESAADALANIGAPAVEPLIAALLHKNLREAAAPLGMIRDARAVEPLIAVLKGEDLFMSLEAAEALGKIRDARAVEPLIVALEERPKGLDLLPEAAARALGEIGNVRAVGPLVAALKTTVREAAHAALNKITVNENTGAPAVEPLMILLKDHEPRVRKEAAAILARTKDTRAVEPLLTVLNDMDQQVRWEAAYALREIADARATEPLIDALRDPYEGVRDIAAEALGKIGNARAVDALVGRLKNENNNMRRVAAQSLGYTGDVRAVEPLMATLKDGDEDVRKAAVLALEKIGDVRAVKPLLANLEDGDAHVRKAAAESLEKVGWKPGSDEASVLYWMAKEKWDECVKIGLPAVKPLIVALKHDEAGAAYALAAIGDARAVEPLIACLKHGNPSVVEALISMYQSGKLDNAGKKLILAHRKEIASPHSDRWAGEEGMSQHYDAAAIEFPL